MSEEAGPLLITLTLKDKLTTHIRAEVFGEFAAHFINPFTGEWRVTHIASGAAVRDFPDQETAVAMAEKLDAAKIPGIERVRVRETKSGKVQVVDPEGALAGMRVVLNLGSHP